MCNDSFTEFKKVIMSDSSKTNIAIIMHSNPDPDCMASSMGMSRILKTWNPSIKCTLIYSGEISHSQNRTMVNVLSIPLIDIAEIEDLKSFDYLISVDVMPERAIPINNNNPSEFLMVVDHHKVETKLAKIKDIRTVGATASIIWDYLKHEQITFEKNNEEDALLATALAVAIKTDTQDLVTENVTDLDWEASQQLMRYVDRGKLSSIMEYPIPSYQLELRSKLDIEDNYKMDNGIFVGGIGHIAFSKRDVLPILARERARLEDVNTAFVFAIVGDHIEVSVRSINLAVDVTSLCQKIFGRDFAGGKMGAGAAKVPMGFLSLDSNVSEDIREKQWEFVKAYLIDKIFHIINNA